jgi:hypothetical protein
MVLSQILQITVRSRRSFIRCPAEVHWPKPVNVRTEAVPAYGKYLTCGSDKEKVSACHTSSSKPYRT